MRKLLTLALVAGASIASAQPVAATVSAWDGSGATDNVNWGQLGPSFTILSSGISATSANGLTVTVTDGDGIMERRDQGNGWNGNFAPGEQLLWNQNFGTITISFASPVSAAGAQIQSTTLFSGFEARITTNDGSSFDVPGFSSNAGADGNPFIGVISNSANITSVTFSLLQPNESFAISDLLLIVPSGVPEPGTWAMMLLGFGAVGLAIRRRRMRVASQAPA